MTKINQLADFENHFSFKDLAKKCIDEIDNTFFKEKVQTYFIGFHLRSFLDTTSPSIDYRSTNNSVFKITQNNLDKGKHPLNHVLDSLLHAKTFKKVLINLTFSKDFNEYLPEIAIKDILCHNIEIGFSTTEINQELKYIDNTSQIHEFCNKLDIEINGSNCSSIFHAIELMSELAITGKYARLLMLRPEKDTGAVVGLTIFFENQIDIDENKTVELFNKLETYSQLISNLNDPPSNSPIDKDFIKRLRLQKVGLSLKDQPNPRKGDEKKVIDTVTEIIGEYKGNCPQDSFFEKSIGTFLDLAYNFADEQLEGKKLTYGLIMGNPGLFDFMDGQKNIMPITIYKSDSEEPVFLRMSDLTENVHLLADHRKNAIIVPYLNDYELSEDGTVPFFVMDISKYDEHIYSWNEGKLMIPEYRPYAYLTYRFKWAVAAVVGPGSQVRIFVGGKIVAFRDGKGWSIYKEPDEILQLITDISGRGKMKKLIDIAVMFSPIYNPESHGGLLVYDFKVTPEKNENNQKNLERLNDNEIIRKKGDKWLKDKNLLEGDYSSNCPIATEDLKVIERLLQISVLDGAIVINGENFTVQAFGQRLNYSCPPDNDFGGTKRKTAVGFIDKCSDVKGRNIAIAISSDGPVRIFHKKYTHLQNGKNVYKPLIIFERIKNK